MPSHSQRKDLLMRHDAPNSITSSARARRVGGISRPSVLAVFRLITGSKLVGPCSAIGQASASASAKPGIQPTLASLPVIARGHEPGWLLRMQAPMGNPNGLLHGQPLLADRRSLDHTV
jgi:hypothetical protein